MAETIATVAGSGLNFAPATWQNAQLSGGSIFEWQTRQSAIWGMLILLTWLLQRAL